MSLQNDQENELRRRERELQEREQVLRLREIEAEINEPPLYRTQKHQPLESSQKQWYGKLLNVGKFLALVAGVVVAINLVHTGASSPTLLTELTLCPYKST